MGRRTWKLGITQREAHKRGPRGAESVGFLKSLRVAINCPETQWDGLDPVGNFLQRAWQWWRLGGHEVSDSTACQAAVLENSRRPHG